MRPALRGRLERHALDRWGEHCRAIDVRFRGAFAYVDALAKNSWHATGTSSESRERIDATPTHLCRLGYLGSADRWAFAFYKYSDGPLAGSRALTLAPVGYRLFSLHQRGLPVVLLQPVVQFASLSGERVEPALEL